MQKFIRFILLAQIIFLTGCFDKRIEDTPEMRKSLAMKICEITFSSGYFDAIRTQAINGSMDLIASEMRNEIGRELTQSEYKKVSEAFAIAFDETAPKNVWIIPMAELYEKYFDSNELNEILKFYNTEVGKKTLRTSGIMVSEGAQVGEKLMKSKEKEIDERFQKELAKQFGK